MNKNSLEKQRTFPGRLGTTLCMWFLGGLFLSMLLSGIYTLLGVPAPPLFFFLSAFVYLTGGMLGGIWSRENLHRRGLAWTDMIVAIFILIVSGGFLFTGTVFVVMGLQHF